MADCPRRVIFFVPFLVFLPGCSGPKGRAVSLDFLKDGVTSKREALAELGEPTGTFEENHILTWRIDKNDAGYHEDGGGGIEENPLGPSSGMFVHSDYSLVLVFDKTGILRHHALVPVKVAPHK